MLKEVLALSIADYKKSLKFIYSIRRFGVEVIRLLRKKFL